MTWKLFLQGARRRRARRSPPLCKTFRPILEALEVRLTPANQPPVTPVVTEPTSDGVIISGFDVHMVTAPFADPDLGDTNAATDWEIWTTGPTAQPVWVADGVTDTVLKYHIHLGDGTFVN